MLTLAQITPHLVHQFASEADLVRAVGELSEAFTKDRARIGDYLSDRRLVAAYTAFYLTTNLPKLEKFLAWLPPGLRGQLLGQQLIDVGAGPGTFSLAWKLLGGGTPVMWESSPLMREQAGRLLEGITQTKACFDLPVDASANRLLFFGHAANEMGEQAVWDYIGRAHPQSVLFIEPGTPEVFQLMLRLRARFVRDDWHIAYPCLGSAACPLGPNDWCHQIMRVSHAPDVERLTQLARKDRRKLPVVAHLYQRAAPRALSHDFARIVRLHPPTKFSHDWEVCRAAGDQLEHERFQLPFKNYPKTLAESVGEMGAGDLIHHWQDDRMVGTVRRIKLSFSLG